MKKTFTILFLFSISLLAFSQNINCYEITSTLERLDYPGNDVNGPYYPGERLKFNFNVVFESSPGGQGNNCQWIQGIVPTINDNFIYNIEVEGLDETWSKLPSNSVDYNFENQKIKKSNLSNGEVTLEYVPNNGNITSGTLLPEGYWQMSPGQGQGCVADKDPDNMWGRPAGCGTFDTFTYSMTLTVKPVQEITDCENAKARLSMFIFGDGETGCWANAMCSNEIPFQFNGSIDCTSLISNTTDLNTSVKIYPTIIDNSLIIENINAYPIDIKVYNNVGKVISRSTMDSGKKLIDASQWANGNYIIKLASKEESISKKVIKI